MPDKLAIPKPHYINTLKIKKKLFSAVMKDTPFHFNFTTIKPEIDNCDLKSAIEKIGIAYMSIFDTPERIAFTRTIIRDSNKHPEISNMYHKNGIGYVAQCVADYLEKFKIQLRPDIDLYLAAKTYVGSLFAFAVQYKIIIGVDRQYTDEEIVKLSSDIFYPWYINHRIDKTYIFLSFT